MKNKERNKKIRLYICGAVLIIAASIMLPYAIDTFFSMLHRRIEEMQNGQTESMPETLQQSSVKGSSNQEENSQATESAYSEEILYTETVNGLRQKFIPNDAYMERFETTIKEYLNGVYEEIWTFPEICFSKLEDENEEQIVCLLKLRIFLGRESLEEDLIGTFNKEFCFYGFYPADMSMTEN